MIIKSIKRLITLLVFAGIYINAQTPELIVPTGHVNWVRSAKLSPNGKILASFAFENRILLWDYESGKLLKSIKDSNDVETVKMSFSKDGKKIYYLCSKDRFIKVADIETGKITEKIEFPSIVNNFMLNSDDSKLICSIYNDSVMLKCHMVYYNLISKTVEREFVNLPDFVKLKRLSNDNNSMIAIDENEQIIIIDLLKQQVISKLKVNTKFISSVDFNQNSDKILITFSDSLMIYNIKNNIIENIYHRNFSGEDKHFYVKAIFFRNDSMIAACNDLGELELINATSLTKKNLFSTGEYTFEALLDESFFFIELNGDKEIITGGGFGQIYVWDIQSEKLSRRIKGTGNWIFSLSIVDSNNKLFCGSGLIWDLSGKQNPKYLDDKKYFLDVKLSPDGKWICSYTGNGIFLYSPENFSDTVRPEANRFDGNFVFSNDSRLLLFSAWNNLEIFDLNKRKYIDTLKISDNEPAHCIKFSHSNKLLATTCFDSTLRIWKTNGFSLYKEVSLKNRIVSIISMEFSEDDSLLYCANENSLFVFNTSNWRIINSVDLNKGMSVLKISNNGRYLFVGGYWDIDMFKLNNLEKFHTFSGHDGYITDLELSKDDKYLFSSSSDGTIKIWDLEKLKIAATLIPVGKRDWTVISPDGYFDASENAMEDMYWTVGLEMIDLAQLKERYYEPGLLSKLLGYSSEPLRDIKGFNEVELFPQITIIPESEDNSRFDIKLTNRGGGIGKVTISINGKEIDSDARGIDFNTPDTNELVIENINIKDHPYLKPGKNTITVKSYNSRGYLSSKGVDVEYNSESLIYSPEFWGIIIGASEYGSDKLKLRYAAKDAVDIYSAIKIGAERLFGPDKTHIKLLSTDSLEQPYKQNIIDAFNEFKKAKSGDVLLVYLAGHGISITTSEGIEDFYYLTKEARSFDDLKDPVIREKVSISGGELTELTKLIPANNQVLIMDVCGSGKIVDKLSDKREVPSSQIRALERMKDRAGLNILTGCTADAVSYESSRYSQGVLTYSILMGIKGGALKDDKFIDISRLFQYSRDNVPVLAKDIGGIQEPKIFGSESIDIGMLTTDDKKLIPLSIARPLILQTNFQDLNMFLDNLGIGAKLDDKLREASSRGKESKFVFVDAKEFPDAYFLAGRYELQGNEINASIKLFRKNVEEFSFNITGNTNDLDSFINNILNHLNETIK